MKSSGGAIRQNTIQYIDGVKGFACLMVMLGHYLGVYKYAEKFPVKIGILDAVLNSKLNFLLNESYYLYLFFIVSGYLIARSSVPNLPELIKKVVIRFLRLALPILCSSAIVFFLCIKWIGMHNAETSSLFVNHWFQNNYYNIPVTFENLFYSPLDALLLAEASINPPYWCLKGMFIGSVVIYIVDFLLYKLSGRPELQVSLIFLSLICSLHFSFDGVRTACLVGMALWKFEKHKEEFSKTASLAFWMIVSSILLYVYEEQMMISLLFAVLIFYLPKWEISNKILSSRPFQFLGDISWGVYSFHWPIYSSIGALLILNVNTGGLVSTWVIGMLVSIILTVIISILYRYTFEIVTSKLISRLKNLSFEFKKA